MGIDVYLKWDGMTEKEKQDQVTGFDTTMGRVGYLREAYHGGPYATKMLVREAFEAETCEAEIPAAVMRERLTHVTEPARNCDDGHHLAAMFTHVMRMMAEMNGGEGPKVEGGPIAPGITEPMTVEEAIYERCTRLYPEAGLSHFKEVLKSFQDFVALAERKEKETGKPCTVYASY